MTGLTSDIDLRPPGLIMAGAGVVVLLSAVEWHSAHMKFQFWSRPVQ